MSTKQASRLMITFAASLFLTVVVIQLVAFGLVNPILACVLTIFTGTPALTAVVYMWSKGALND